MAGPSSLSTPHISFSIVIEDDHRTINRYAARLKKAKTSQDRTRLLGEVTWRMVRHDISEEIIMRPALIAHLGATGEQMAEHDRLDHERARIELMALFKAGVDEPDFLPRVNTLMAELHEHMRTESGEQIPALEAMLGPSESQRLGREYIKTFALAPELEMLDSAAGFKRRVWAGVKEYASMDSAGFRAVWENLTDEQVSSAMSAYHGSRSGDGRGRGKL
ncbi:hypothetical protein LTR10_014056 [Elasticomyces elasticus]|uniref:Hemerythrin-like domain-containing protein n=1 Tax=Exophiala sideris TaxID=1016849 RepID=A0ABR0J3T7_9EURO|nr:hypothetical protein LTR10_014056 [Elasticomyces elasticus]KAK5026462.1 hypothetical protein LTS07_007396 [Exophiala sideris]KAK5033796.1 hypothetical protein LTR13_006848 [Exophiala sideris]KAK5055618.1 hypothetical protein LTR69_008451 [Exophiala sideris]KAK5179997.1 hypothetical protein LTR44_007473 [Eurotiomycetes sp. CCFEE 6388]